MLQDTHRTEEKKEFQKKLSFRSVQMIQTSSTDNIKGVQIDSSRSFKCQQTNRSNTA